MAILLAGYHPSVKLLGISTVASNQVGFLPLCAPISSSATLSKLSNSNCLACSSSENAGKAPHQPKLHTECVGSRCEQRTTCTDYHLLQLSAVTPPRLICDLLGCSRLCQVVDKTTRNALDILDWIGLKDIGGAVAGLCACMVH